MVGVGHDPLFSISKFKICPTTPQWHFWLDSFTRNNKIPLEENELYTIKKYHLTFFSTSDTDSHSRTLNFIVTSNCIISGILISNILFCFKVCLFQDPLCSKFLSHWVPQPNVTASSHYLLTCHLLFLLLSLPKLISWSFTTSLPCRQS